MDGWLASDLDGLESYSARETWSGLMTLPTDVVVEWNDREAVGPGDAVRVDHDGHTRHAVVVELIDAHRIVVRAC